MKETVGWGWSGGRGTVIIRLHAYWPNPVFVICSLCELRLGMFITNLWFCLCGKIFQQWKERPLNAVMYRNRVEICSMFDLLFIFSSLTAAVQRLGSGILPHAHPCVFDVVLLLFLCPSTVLLRCEHCRWILQSDYIVQDCLTCLDKKTDKQRDEYFDL